MTRSAKSGQLHTRKSHSETIMSSSSTSKPFVAPTPGSTKASTPDSSMHFAKSTDKNETKTPALLSTVITPQHDKDKTKQADIDSTPINKPSNLPSELLRTTPIASHRSNSLTKGDMITCDINSELPVSQDEHTKVTSPCKSDSMLSNTKPLTSPTREPPASAVRTELLAMMDNLRANMGKRLQELKEEEIMPLSDFMKKISTTVFTQADTLQKVECNLDVATQNISKLDTRLTSQKEIYAVQRKDINRCIFDIANLDQKNKVIHSCFEEKLNKAILDTKQVAMKLSEACNKAPAPQFHVPDSRFDDINKTLHDHDKEIQNMTNKISIYSQKKGHFAGTHPTVLNYNDTTELFPILKPTKH